jgi:hypothetical protein
MSQCNHEDSNTIFGISQKFDKLAFLWAQVTYMGNGRQD